MVVHRPSASRNRHRWSGQTTSPSSIQPRPSGPPAWGTGPRAPRHSPRRGGPPPAPRPPLRHPATFFNLVQPADRHPFGHDPSLPRTEGNRFPKSLGLASEAIQLLESRESHFHSQSAMRHEERPRETYHRDETPREEISLPGGAEPITGRDGRLDLKSRSAPELVWGVHGVKN